MKYIFGALYICLLFEMCSKPRQAQTFASLKLYFPPSFSNMLQNHGGIDRWQTFEAIEFTVNKSEGSEDITVDLRSRDTKLVTSDFTIYKNASGCFVTPDLAAFKGDPLFYHSVYFYFVAMPFVLADPGIEYEPIGAYRLDSMIYDGVRLRFKSGVGDADQDEYIVLYDEDTGRMEWLLYTVTYFDQAKSSKWALKHYKEWQDVNGLMLPSTIVSYRYEDNKIIEKRGEVTITDYTLSKESLPEETFEAPLQAEKFVNE